MRKRIKALAVMPLLAGLVLFLAAGCGKKGPPLPPLPEGTAPGAKLEMGHGIGGPARAAAPGPVRQEEARG